MRYASRLVVFVVLAFLARTSAWADDAADVLAANRRYERAFSSLDIKAMEAAWAHDPSVSVIHPSSKAVLAGWDAVRKSYADQPSRHKDFSVTMENPAITIRDDIAWVVGLEKVHTVLTNGEAVDLSVSATSIFGKRNGVWLMVHHHGSRTPQ
jgi:ketosteroid isomerase-like protein